MKNCIGYEKFALDCKGKQNRLEVIVTHLCYSAYEENYFRMYHVKQAKIRRILRNVVQIDA